LGGSNNVIPTQLQKKRQATALKALTHHSGFAARM
jgi:hypothetical protein